MITAVLPRCRPGSTRWMDSGIADLPVARWMLFGTQRSIGSILRTPLFSVAVQSAEKARLSGWLLSKRTSWFGTFSQPQLTLVVLVPLLEAPHANQLLDRGTLDVVQQVAVAVVRVGDEGHLGCRAPGLPGRESARASAEANATGATTSFSTKAATSSSSACSANSRAGRSVWRAAR